MSLQVELLEESFAKIKPRANEFATSFYDNLFTAYPEAKPLFANTDLPEQQKKLLASLVLVVDNLRVPDVLTETLQGLGARHVRYGALPEHYPLVGNALLTTFEQYLGFDWTAEVKQAWVDAYGAITKLMLDGADYSADVLNLDAEAVVNNQPEPLPSAAATAESKDGLQVELLEASFAKVKPRANEFAVSFYDNLFTAYPEAKPLFANTNLPEQQKKLLASLVLVVDNLRKPEVLTEALHGLGARHVRYGALPEHYPLVGNALLTTFEQYLGSEWTAEVKQAWVDAYGAITKLMLDGADYSADVLNLEAHAMGSEASDSNPQTTPMVEPEAFRASSQSFQTNAVDYSQTAPASEEMVSQPSSELNWGMFAGVFGGAGIVAILLIFLL